MDYCPCGDQKTYENCCEPYISNKSLPQTAEALMRSRYSAYVKQQVPYISSTHLPGQNEDFDETAAKEWAKNSEWIGLEVLETEGGQVDDNKGSVEFIASYKVKDNILRHHEVAHFVKQKDRWYYADGDIMGTGTIRREGPKVGRNDPCPCGSGKKFKKCCC